MGNPLRKLTLKTVLLVEDNKHNLFILKRMLEQSGINVIPAVNGQEAVNIFLQNENIDLVLMDLKMPVMDGYNSMREIKKIKPGIKVIAETAFALDGDENKIIDAGFDGYLSKPITRKSLNEIINLFLK